MEEVSHCFSCKTKTENTDSVESVGKCKGRDRVYIKSKCATCGKNKCFPGKVLPKTETETETIEEKPKRATKRKINSNDNELIERIKQILDIQKINK